MPGRINVKLLIILAAICILIPVAGAGYYYLTKNAAAWSKRGDEYFAKGDYVEAIKAYGRAMNKDTDDIQLIYKYAEANAESLTDNITDARNRLQQVEGAYQRANTQSPRDPEPFLKAMDLYMKMATEVNPQYFSVMLARADAKLEQNNMDQARKYRGIGVTQQMTGLEIPEEDRELAGEDLRFALELNSNDTEASFYLALWEMLEAKRLDTVTGNPEQAATYRDQALQRVADDVANNPDDPKIKLNQLRIMLFGSIAGQEITPEAEQLLGELERQMLEKSGDVVDLFMLAQLIRQIDQEPVDNPENNVQMTRGLQRAEALLAAARKVYPDDIRVLVKHGDYQKQSGQFEAALQSFSKAREMTFYVKPFQAMNFGRYQEDATRNYIELMLGIADKSDDDVEKQKTFDKVETVLNQVVAAKSMTQGRITLLQGKLALARRDIPKAANLLTQASRELGDRDLDALNLSAATLMQNGQWGEAARQYERLLELIGGYTQARKQLVKLYLRTRQFNKAEEHLAILYATNPEDADVLSLRVGLYSQKGDHDQAITLAKELGLDKNPATIYQMASVYDAADRSDEATALLLQNFQHNAANVALLENLLRRIDDPGQRKQLVEQARAADADPKLLLLIEQQYIEGGIATEDVIASLEDKFDDPRQKYEATYDVFQRAGQMDEALKALAELEKLAPDHPKVINRRFAEAVMNQDWDSGEQWVERAAQADLDQAGGDFYRARLAAARGDLAKANTFFQQGLAKRPVYYEGWRQYGDILRNQQKLVEAQNAYEKALEQRPDDVASLFGLALVHSTRGDNVKALALLTQAHEYAPENYQIKKLYMAFEQQFGDAEKAMALRQEHLDEFETDFENRKSMAMLLAEKGDYEKALEMIDQLIEDQLPNMTNTLAKAQILALADQPDEGRKLLLQYVNGIDEEELHSDHWIAVARYLISINQFDSAMSAYRRAAELEDPQTRPATRELAQRLVMARKYEDAAIQYRSLLQTNPQDRIVAMALVEALMNDEQLDKAEAQLKQLVDEFGADHTALLLEANLKQKKGDTTEAIKLFDRAAELAPKQPIVFLSRGAMRANDPNQDDAAIADLERAVELDPTLVAARIKLAAIYNRRGDTRDAVRELKTIISQNPQSDPARRQLLGVYLKDNDSLSAKRLVQESIDISRNRTFWIAQLGNLEFEDKDYASAADLYQQVLQEDLSAEEKVNFIARLANTHFMAKDYSQALDTLRAYPAELQQSPKLKTIQVLALWRTGDSNKANILLQNVLGKSQSYGEVSAVAEQLAVGLQNDKAIEFLSSIQATEEHQLWLMMAIAELQLKEAQFGQAYAKMIEAQAIIEQYPANQSSYQLLFAAAAHQAGYPDEAKSTYQQLAEKYPNSVTVMNNYAFLLLETGETQLGMDFATKAFQLRPDNPLVLDTLGWAYFKAREYEKARNTLMQSIDIEPSGANYYHLAEVLIATGDQNQAIEYLNKAEKLAEKSNDKQVLEDITRRLQEMNN